VDNEFLFVVSVEHKSIPFTKPETINKEVGYFCG